MGKAIEQAKDDSKARNYPFHHRQFEVCMIQRGIDPAYEKKGGVMMDMALNEVSFLNFSLRRRSMKSTGRQDQDFLQKRTSINSTQRNTLENHSIKMR